MKGRTPAWRGWHLKRAARLPPAFREQTTASANPVKTSGVCTVFAKPGKQVSVVDNPMAKASRRQHFIARFYLRNFAEPMFSENLCVFDMRKRRWERRTPEGVGWFSHLCSMIDAGGNRTDDFDQFLKRNVEDPAAPALKKLAVGGAVDPSERSAVALFIALTAARSPKMIETVVESHLAKLTHAERNELDDLAKRWCHWIGRSFDAKSLHEFLKPSSFGAIWLWSQNLQRRLIDWDWHLIKTTNDQPFVTSDRPVFAQWDLEMGVRLVSFPVSSEIAIIVSNGRLNTARDSRNDVAVMNRQTLDSATEFVVACREAALNGEVVPGANRNAKGMPTTE